MILSIMLRQHPPRICSNPLQSREKLCLASPLPTASKEAAGIYLLWSSSADCFK